MKHPTLIDPNAMNPLRRGPLCQRFRRVAISKGQFWRLLDASLLVTLIAGAFGFVS